MALSSNWTGSWPLKPEIVSSSLRRVTSGCMAEGTPLPLTRKWLEVESRTVPLKW